MNEGLWLSQDSVTRVISKSSRATDPLQRLMIFSSLPTVTSIFLRQRKCYWGKKALFFTLLPTNRVNFVFFSGTVHNSMAVFRKLQPGKLKKKTWLIFHFEYFTTFEKRLTPKHSNSTVITLYDCFDCLWTFAISLCWRLANKFL